MKRVSCKRCKKNAWVHENSRGISLCDECKVEQWYRKMKQLGCNVISPSDIGKFPLISPKGKKDLQKILIDGIEYVDVTDCIFEDTKYVKKFILREEFEKLEDEIARKIMRSIKGVKKNKVGRKPVELTDEQKEEIIKLYEDRYSYHDIAYIIGVSTTKVEKYLAKKRQIGELKSRGKLRPKIERTYRAGEERVRLRYTNEEEQKLIDLKESGKSYEQIAIKLNRSVQGVEEKYKRMKRKAEKVSEC